MRTPGSVVASAMALLLGACSNGPGELKYTNEFAVATRSPADGDANVHVTVPFTATFTRALDPATVVDGNVQVAGNGGAPLAKTLSLSQDQKTLTITLLSAPTLPAAITVAFQGLEDILGNAAPRDQWSFTMPEWWEPFGTPEVSDVASVVLDGRGYPAIAWCGVGGIHVVRWSEEGWAAMGQVLSHGGSNVCPPVLTRGYAPSGTTYVDAFAVAWEELDGPTSSNKKAYVAVWADADWRDPSGSTVASAGPVASSSATRLMTPTVTVDGNGGLYVAAVNGLTLSAWRWAPGATAWTSLGSLSSDATKQAGAPSSARTGLGAVMAWTERPAASFSAVDVYASVLSNGVATRLASGSKLNATGRIAMSTFVAPTTNPLIAFTDRDSSSSVYGVQVFHASSTRLSSACTGQIPDDTSIPVGGLAMASGSTGTWLAFEQGGQIRVKSCDLTGVRLEGTPATANAAGVDFLGFAGEQQDVPTVAYLDRGPPPPPGAPRPVTNPNLRYRVKQPNR